MGPADILPRACGVTRRRIAVMGVDEKLRIPKERKDEAAEANSRPVGLAALMVGLCGGGGGCNCRGRQDGFLGESWNLV